MVSFVSAARDISRMREISTVLIRHGFGEVVSRLGLGGGRKVDAGEPGTADSGAKQKRRLSPSVRIRLVLEDLGPSFVKLGQIASTRPDLLPADLITELKKLQDSLPPLPYSEIKEQVERSLGAPIEELFESFEQEPLATASIAQVHRARLRTEEGSILVAAKVQRPGIAAKVASDVDLLHTLAALLERAIPETRIYSPVGLVRQFDQAITAELDFITEAENARRFAQNFVQNDDVIFPAIYAQASSKHVVTMQFLEGRKIYDAINEGHSGEKIARLAFRTMIKQIYEDGFFHADPHPGNVLIGGTFDRPTLGLIDLGMVGRLSPRMRELTIDVITSALRKDHDGIAEALYAIGTPTKKIDMEAFKAEVALLSDKYLGRPLRDLEISGMIRDLVSAATRYGIEIPTDFVMMGKALMTIEGIGKEIHPGFDVYEEAKPLFTELLKKRYSPERMGTELLRRIEKLGGAGYKVPQQLEEVLDDLRLGRLSLQVEDRRNIAAVDRFSRRSTVAVLVAAEILAGAVLVSSGENTLGYGLLALAFITLATHTVFEAWRIFRQR